MVRWFDPGSSHTRSRFSNPPDFQTRSSGTWNTPSELPRFVTSIAISSPSAFTVPDERGIALAVDPLVEEALPVRACVSRSTTARKSSEVAFL